MNNKPTPTGRRHISKRPDGRFQGYITLTDGSRRSASRDKRKDVADRLDEIERELLEEAAMVPDDPFAPHNMTVGTYLDDWLQNTQRINVKPTTFVNDESLVRKHIKPRIGDVRLQELTTQHLNKLQEELENDPDEPATVYARHAVHTLLMTALKCAVETYELISRNPAERANRPTLPEAERTTFTESQHQRFNAAIKGHPYEALFVLASLTGMRQGEILGLQWDDINFKKGTISVKRTLAVLKRREMIAQAPKTKASKRTIEPHGLVMKVLEEHQERMQEQFPESAWVFVWKDGEPVCRWNIYRVYKKVLREANLPDIRFHDLRHTAGTLLMAAGENPKVVQSLLGHSHVSITLSLYSHASEDLTARAANTLGELATPETENSVGKKVAKK